MVLMFGWLSKKLKTFVLHKQINAIQVHCCQLHLNSSNPIFGSNSFSMKPFFSFSFPYTYALGQWKKIGLDLFIHCLPSSYLPLRVQEPMPRFTNSKTCVKTWIIKLTENLLGKSRIRTCHENTQIHFSFFSESFKSRAAGTLSQQSALPVHDPDSACC